MSESPRSGLRGRRILCLDDGGIRCLSSLLVLARLMMEVKVRSGAEVAPEPWQHFDLICGTGFGGIFALMLGRLRMSILECQDWFIKHCVQIFEQRQTWMSTMTTPTPEVRSRILEKAIKSLMLEHASEPDDRLAQDFAEPIKTFVLTMYASNMRVPARLRSYSSRMDPAAQDLKIWEAAMATAASPGEFAQVKMGAMGLSYVSAGLGFSNPAKEALDEADRIWQLSNIGCLVSIGTGMMPPACLENQWESMKFLNYLSLDNIARVPELLTTFFRAATDCERVHEELLRDARLLNIKYFRFNVEDGLQDVGRHETSKIDKIEIATKIYLDRRDIINSLVFSASHIFTSVYEGPQQPLNSSKIIGKASRELIPQLQKVSVMSEGVSPHKSRQQGRPVEPASDEWNTGNLFDARYADVALDDSYTSLAADDWFRELGARVHTVLSRRPQEDIKRVKVAILDTGIDALHPMFSGHVFDEENCRDWTGSNAPKIDNVGHGTHTAGLVLRVAPRCSLCIGKVFDSTKGSAQTPQHVADAIDYATQVWDVNILTMSFGFARYDDRIRDAIEKAQNRGVIIFAAASNEGAVEGKEAAFPARMVGKVIKISSADGGGAASKFNPSLSASNDNFSILGEAVNSAWPTALQENGEKRGSGTSIATAIAAGTAALVLEFARQLAEPDELTPIENEEILWRYYGMRAIFVLMSRDSIKDGFSWVRPWALFANGSVPERTEEISRQISYELKRV